MFDLEGPGHTWGVGRALTAIKSAPSGVMVFLNCNSPGDRLLDQISAWDASNIPQGRGRMDLRTYGIGAQILRDLNVGQMRLLARPRKIPSILPGFGLTINGYASPEQN